MTIYQGLSTKKTYNLQPFNLSFVKLTEFYGNIKED
jgi:hypothetical protein